MEKQKQESLVIVICTCDAYQDALGPLFTLLTRYWPQCKNYKIVLNTESLDYQFDGLEITSFNLYGGKTEGITWSKRLRDTLEQISSKYVFIYLDDFYLCREVDNDMFNKCVDFLDMHENAANINVHYSPSHKRPLKDFPLLARRSRLSRYLLNLQASIWRRDCLMDCLREHESAWDLERFGSIRAMFSRRDFYTVLTPIFYYRPDLHGLSRGKWNPHTPELFNKEGIVIDFSRRGVLQVGEWTRPHWNINLQKLWRSFVK